MCLVLANVSRGRTADICWLYVTYFHCVKGKKVQTNSIYQFFLKFQELKEHGADYLIIFINSGKMLNILSFNGESI